MSLPATRISIMAEEKRVREGEIRKGGEEADAARKTRRMVQRTLATTKHD